MDVAIRAPFDMLLFHSATARRFDADRAILGAADSLDVRIV